MGFFHTMQIVRLIEVYDNPITVLYAIDIALIHFNLLWQIPYCAITVMLTVFGQLLSSTFNIVGFNIDLM